MKERLNESLKQYSKIIDQIDFLELALEMTKSDLERLESGKLSKVYLVKDLKASQLKYKIDHIKKELVIKRNQNRELNKLVSNFTELEQKIINMKYLKNITLESIACELGYSKYYIQTKHKNSMDILNFVFELKGI